MYFLLSFIQEKLLSNLVLQILGSALMTDSREVLKLFQISVLPARVLNTATICANYTEFYVLIAMVRVQLRGYRTR